MLLRGLWFERWYLWSLSRRTLRAGRRVRIRLPWHYWSLSWWRLPFLTPFFRSHWSPHFMMSCRVPTYLTGPAKECPNRPLRGVLDVTVDHHKLDHRIDHEIEMKVM